MMKKYTLHTHTYIHIYIYLRYFLGGGKDNNFVIDVWVINIPIRGNNPYIGCHDFIPISFLQEILCFKKKI